MQPLSPKKLKAITLLIAGHSIGEVSNIVGVTPKALWVWRQDETFREQLHNALNKQESEILETIKCQRLKAIDTLVTAMQSDNLPVAVKAAIEVLNRSTPAIPAVHIIKDESEKLYDFRESLAKALMARTLAERAEKSELGESPDTGIDLEVTNADE